MNFICISGRWHLSMFLSNTNVNSRQFLTDNLTMQREKRYGLTTAKPSIFGDDSESDSEQARPTGLKSATAERQERLLRARAVAEDPTVFQYDELYDDMQAKRNESKLSRRDLDKRPKYIGRLLQSAERRKRENERRIERQVQREREAEGGEFADKDAFVTSAYKAKLEELRQLDEQERREDYLEAIGDVRKQENLDGFYRHLYDQKVLYDDKDAKRRKYRKRNDSESDAEEVAPLGQHLQSNLDADSDFSIDSSNDSEGDNKETLVPETKDTVISNIIVENVREEKPVVKMESKPKVDIWKKRTVGEAFDAALKRYFERKALRESGNYMRPCL